MNPDPFSYELKTTLKRASRIAIIGISGECSPVDRLGMDAARIFRHGLVPQSGVFPEEGTVPENITAPVCRDSPDNILLPDAADTDARPGTEVYRPGTGRGIGRR
jgi:hypothetical protein